MPIVGVREDAVLMDRCICTEAKTIHKGGKVMEYPSIDMQATGERIRFLRVERHLRVEDIAIFMGFESPNAVYKWQRGECLPTVDNLYALSRLFETTIDDILIPMREEDECLPLDLCADDRTMYVLMMSDLLFGVHIRVMS